MQLTTIKNGVELLPTTSLENCEANISTIDSLENEVIKLCDYERGKQYKAIKDGGLYKSVGSWEFYCNSRGVKRRHSDELILHTNTVDVIEFSGAVAPENKETFLPEESKYIDSFKDDWDSLPPDLQKGISYVASDHIIPQTERQTRPLNSLPDEDKPKAWAEAVIRNGGEQPTGRQVSEVVKEMKPHVSHNSGQNEWYTPEQYILAVHSVLGGIDLDPASNDMANKIVKADNYYTIDDDGLSRDWQGRVFLNPPYSSNLIGKFSNKIRRHVEAGDIVSAIILVNNATETNWFNDLICVSSAVCFPNSRVKFYAPNGAIAAPLQGQAVLYIGNSPDKFKSEFLRFGWVATL